MAKLVDDDYLASPARDTSIKIFRRYIGKVTDAHGAAKLDASAVIGRECFEEWKESRKSSGGDYEKGFQRSLTAHLTRSDGRRPFDPDEEAAVLLVVRARRVWPAFEGTSLKIGQKGFRALGFHEHVDATCAPLASSAGGILSPVRTSPRTLLPSLLQDVPGLSPFSQPAAHGPSALPGHAHKDSDMDIDMCGLSLENDAAVVLDAKPPSPMPELCFSPVLVDEHDATGL
jgi:hypothetical protein